jgi:hypothetical protein
MRIYIVEGTREGQMCNILVTTNIEKAKSMIIDDGYNIEVWENDELLGHIQYFESEGFVENAIIKRNGN